jgi:uncharacterized protein YcbK (DUF882 family)
MKTIKIKKGCVANVSENFKYHEYDCKCGRQVCTETLISEELTQKLQRLRELTGCAPIVITSGYRCSAYQEELRVQGYETAKGKSSHELGLAVDIVCGAYDGAQLTELAEKAGFQNIGTARRFIHLDVRPGGPRRWGYLKR